MNLPDPPGPTPHGRPGPTQPGRLALLLSSLTIDFLYFLATPLLLALLIFASRAFTRPKLGRGLLRKLGLGLKARDGSSPLLWIHAVSVGEVNTAVPLVEALRRRSPELEICVSVSTFTGFTVAEQRLRGVSVIYAPLDFSFVVNKFLRNLKPQALVLIELELWPNLLLCARREGIAVLVANARLSERSARRYQWGRGLTRRLFNLPTAFGAQSEACRERLLSVGVEPAKIRTLGNLKHDREPSPLVARAPGIRQRLGWKPGETLVLVGGSTHPGEESTLLAVYGRLRVRWPQLRLVLAPRHVERFEGEELSQWGATEPITRWSSIRDCFEMSPVGGILCVDTVGELEIFYAMADMVFVGGSLIPHGGQNLLEPARLWKPVLFGPSFHNFEVEGHLLLEAGAAVCVANAAELESRLAELLADAKQRERLSRSARSVTERLGGAAVRHVEWIELFFPKTA